MERYSKGVDTFKQYVRFEVGNGSRVLFWQDVWCGEQPLMNAFPALFTIACAKEAWVEENMDSVNGAIHWNVLFTGRCMIGNWKKCQDSSSCCILNKLGRVERIKFVGLH